MPECPVPLLECESLEGIGYLSGYFEGTTGFDERDAYLKTRYSFAGGGWILYTLSGAVTGYLGGHRVTDPITQDITDSPPFTGIMTSANEGPVSVATARADSYSAMLGALDFEDAQLAKGNSCGAKRIHNIPWHGAGPPDSSSYLFSCLIVEFFRYRWKIPSGFTGSTFKITWDEVFFPEGYDPDDPNSPQPSPVARDLTTTWSGPGTPDDEASWLASGWRAVNPPDQPGETRVVNIRFECYTSPYGKKPQVTGEAVDLDA